MAELVRTFRLLELRAAVAAVGALLLAVSTFGPFSFVEVAEILVALGVLALLRARALGKRFHLPFGDGTVIAAAGVWAGAADRGAAVRPPARTEPARAGLRGDPRVRGRCASGPSARPTTCRRSRSRRRRARGRRATGDRPTAGRRETHRAAAPRPSSSPTSPQEGEQLRLGGEESKPQPPGDA